MSSKEGFKAIDLPREGENHGRVMVVTGLGGSGKSTLMEAVGPLEGVKVIEMGNVLFEALREKNPGLKTKDDIKRLDPYKVSDAIKLQLALAVVDAYTEGVPTVLITHVLYHQFTASESDFADWYGIASETETYRRIRPLTFVAVYADGETIYRRTTDDATRNRIWNERRFGHDNDELSKQLEISAIERDYNFLLGILNDCRQQTSSKGPAAARLVTLWNRDDNIPENVEKLAELVAEL